MSYIVTKPLKSTGVAVFLAILFGGIGLFYSTILGGIVMTVLFPVILVILFFFGKFLTLILLCCSYYLICLIWAIAGVNSYNKKLEREAEAQRRFNSREGKLEYDLSGEENYYENYRRSLKSDNAGIWLLITIIISVLIFFVIYKFVESP